MNLATCGALPRTPENGVWYRSILLGHLTTALSSHHTRLAASRFNAGSQFPPTDRFPSLYFSDDPLVAQFEVGALLGSPAPGQHIPNPRRALAILNVHVVLHDVIDISDIAAQAALDATAQELTGDWQGYHIRGPSMPVSAPTGIAPTQRLGLALQRTGAEGFRALSAKVPYHRNLIVFTDNLKVGSSLTFADAAGKIVHEIRP